MINVNMYDFKGANEILEGTGFTCKHCNEFFKIKGAYSKLDGDEKKSFTLFWAELTALNSETVFSLTPLAQLTDKRIHHRYIRRVALC